MVNFFDLDDDLEDDAEAGADPDDDEFGADLTSAALVSCPYCGEGVEIPVDQAGGEVQEYVEDCTVCCQPWSVRVSVDREGVPSISVSTLDGG